MGNPEFDPRGSQFTDVDLDGIVRSTFVARVELHREIGSTNDRALELARSRGGDCPLLVLAEVQTAGRGRGANRWWAEPGALTLSLLIEADRVQLPPSRWPQASLTAGLAVCEAVEEFVDDSMARLKWPNDVYVQGRKVCGILVELPADERGMIVVGIGMNVNNSLRTAPKELQSSATSLCDVAERRFSLVHVLERVLLRLAERLQWIGSRDGELRDRWRRRCLLTNRTVHIDCGSRQLVGRCRGIDDDGSLILETPSGPERCFAGAVTSF